MPGAMSDLRETELSRAESIATDRLKIMGTIHMFPLNALSFTALPMRWFDDWTREAQPASKHLRREVNEHVHNATRNGGAVVKALERYLAALPPLTSAEDDPTWHP